MMLWLCSLLSPGPAPSAELEAALESMLAEAQTAWPGVDLDEGVFLARVGQALRDEKDPLQALRSLRGADLYLASACAAQLPRALAALEGVLARVAPSLARLASSPALVDEVLQTLRLKLLVAPAPGEAPRIGDYAGRGPLLSWLRVAAVRTALNLRRNRDDQLDGGLDEGRGHGAVGGDVELQLLGARHRAEFVAALREAMAGLALEQRNLLRMHYLDGLTIAQVAATLQVSRATAVRWIAAAREAIFVGTQRLLQERMGLSESGFASLAGALHAELEASIAGVLRGATVPDGA